MKEAFVIDKEFLFKTNIYEICSISIEDNYDINGSFLEGELIVSGDYRLHEISINKDDFCFKIPFKHEIKSSVNLDSLELDITDFNYQFNNEDELKVHIEYLISGEENIIEFDDNSKLDEFLEKNNAEVIDLSKDNDIRDEAFNTETILNNSSNEVLESSNDSLDHSFIIDNINSDDSYVKYHIHIVTLNDTIESICTKYNINLNTLKKYNTFDSLELNMKLLIPENEES